MVNNGLYLSRNEAFYNCRIKCRRDSSGALIPYEKMYADRMIFNPDGVVLAERTKAIDWRLAYDEANAELFGGKFAQSPKYRTVPDKSANIDRSKRRAVSRIRDIIMCNDFDCFVTLTLDGSLVDRSDYAAVIKKLNTFLDNRVRRSGLYYVGVPELHKKGGLHFHLLCNSSALALADSGTVSCTGRKRPIKISTADRLHVPDSDRHTVYNVTDWKLGFSTAIMTYGNTGAVARYIGKYISKGSQKVGGRWYYSGGQLAEPVCLYERGGFADFKDFTYQFECDGGHYKILCYDDEGGAIYGDSV